MRRALARTLRRIADWIDPQPSFEWVQIEGGSIETWQWQQVSP